MSFAQPQSRPTKHVLRVGFVILLHVALVWGLMNGLARKLVQIVKAPIDATIIEEVKPPPPPPAKIELPPPPKFSPPPPAFVPPPEVAVQPMAVPQPTISVTTAEPPPAPPLAAPRVEAPPPARAPAPAPAPARAPAAVSASVACSNYSKVMGEAGFPRDALRKGLEKGDALVQFTLGENGEIKDVKALRSSHAVFASNSMRIVMEYKCAGQGHDVVVQVPFTYQHE